MRSGNAIQMIKPTNSHQELFSDVHTNLKTTLLKALYRYVGGNLTSDIYVIAASRPNSLLSINKVIRCYLGQ